LPDAFALAAVGWRLQLAPFGCVPPLLPGCATSRGDSTTTNQCAGPAERNDAPQACQAGEIESTLKTAGRARPWMVRRARAAFSLLSADRGTVERRPVQPSATPSVSTTKQDTQTALSDAEWPVAQRPCIVPRAADKPRWRTRDRAALTFCVSVCNNSAVPA